MKYKNADKICIYPSLDKFGGVVTAPPSKSMAHRYLIAGAFSKQKIIINNMVLSDDVNATIGALSKLGFCINSVENESFVIVNDDKNKNASNVDGGSSNTDDIEIFCGESASTLRFIIPLSLLKADTVVFSGVAGLKTRPLEPYFDIFNKMGVQWDYNGRLPIKISGNLKAGNYDISGNVSSQFVSGLLMALPECEGNSILKLTSELESKYYVQMTMDVLKKFGIQIENNNYREFKICGNQSYKYICENDVSEQCSFSSSEYSDVAVITNEGDFSQSAFWAVSAAIGKQPIQIKKLRNDTTQGDAIIFDILSKMGAKIEMATDTVTVYPSKLKNIDISVKHCPDLVPILAVLGTAAEGVMRIIDAGRLRIKESDRLETISRELNSIGANIRQMDDGLIVEGVLENGKHKLTGGNVNSYADHRIAMSLAIATNLCECPLVLSGAKSVNKSYPNFFSEYEMLGGLLEVQ